MSSQITAIQRDTNHTKASNMNSDVHKRYTKHMKHFAKQLAHNHTERGNFNDNGNKKKHTHTQPHTSNKKATRILIKFVHICYCYFHFRSVARIYVHFRMYILHDRTDCQCMATDIFVSVDIHPYSLSSIRMYFSLPPSISSLENVDGSVPSTFLETIRFFSSSMTYY